MAGLCAILSGDDNGTSDDYGCQGNLGNSITVLSLNESSVLPPLSFSKFCRTRHYIFVRPESEIQLTPRKKNNRKHTNEKKNDTKTITTTN